MKGRHWFIAMPGQCTAVSTEQCSSQWNHGVLSQPCGVIKSSTMSDPCTHAVCVTSSSPPNLSLCRENRETMCALCMASFSPMLLIKCRALVVFFIFTTTARRLMVDPDHARVMQYVTMTFIQPSVLRKHLFTAKQISPFAIFVKCLHLIFRFVPVLLRCVRCEDWPN